ncbi:hypothetical protein JM658_03415 [Joostella atrarenae]|uniref:Uncharacterized protein n=1 Tax=Joostella atrarenae TaxID=679257 RepID=A0ABS9J0A7_9FLAO|nr:hypothetical protein [Joostella atrarenae]MCF8713866.1 hypothetical protein [Joostella atrarenae]
MKKIFFLCLFILLISCEKDSISEEELVVVKAVHYDSATLHYSGNGKWYASFGGVIAWFNGASPSQLENGVRSAWEMTVSPNDPLSYDKNAVISWGGSAFGFHISKTVFGYGEIKKSIKKVTRNSDGSYSSTSVYQYVKQSNSTVANYRGKIILDENCYPIIVDANSDMPSGCMEDDAGGSGDDEILIPY